MNGFLWGQLKTQLCGSRHGGVTDKRRRDMFLKLLISWQKEVRVAGGFLDYHTADTLGLSLPCLVLKW